MSSPYIAILGTAVTLMCLIQSPAKADPFQIPFNQSAAAELFTEDSYERLVASLESREPENLPYWRQTKEATVFLRQLRKSGSLDAVIKDVAAPDAESNPLGAILHGFIKYHKGNADSVPSLWYIQDAIWSGSLSYWLRSDELKEQANDYMVQVYARTHTKMLERGSRNADADPPDNLPLDPLRNYVSTLERLLSSRRSKPSFCATILLCDILTTQHDVSRLFWHLPTIQTGRTQFNTELLWLSDNNIAVAVDSIVTAAELADGDADMRRVHYLRQEVLTAALDLAFLNTGPAGPQQHANIAKVADVLTQCAHSLGNVSPSVSVQNGATPMTTVSVESGQDKQKRDLDQLRHQITRISNPSHGCYPTRVGDVDLRLTLDDWHEGRRLLFMCQVLRRMPHTLDSSQFAASFVFQHLAILARRNVAIGQDNEQHRSVLPSSADLIQADISFYPTKIVVPSSIQTEGRSIRYVLIAGGAAVPDLKADGAAEVAMITLGDAMLCRIVLDAPEKEGTINFTSAKLSKPVAKISVQILQD